MPFPLVKLNDGREVPQLGFGTWKIPQTDCAGEVDQAVGLGFDHIDTAQSYGNQPQVGEALQTIDLPRNKLWITTKWSRSNRSPFDSVQESLQQLGTDHLDLYLIHGLWVLDGDESKIPSTWKDMEEIHKRGWAKSIGVSNYNIPQLKLLLKHATIPPAVNQIELNPYVIKSTTSLLAFMKQHNIACEAYSALISLTSKKGGPVDPVVEKIAKERGIKEEQVLLAWAKYKGAILLTTSRSKERLQAYLDVGDIDLKAHEVEAIDKAGAKGELRAERLKQLKMAGVAVAGLAVGAWAGWRVLFG